MTRRACERVSREGEVAKEEIAEEVAGGSAPKGRVSVKEARRRGGAREAARDTLSGAILVIATRVLLHSPLNNAAPRARTRHARATVCVRERASRGI